MGVVEASAAAGHAVGDVVLDKTVALVAIISDQYDVKNVHITIAVACTAAPPIGRPPCPTIRPLNPSVCLGDV